MHIPQLHWDTKEDVDYVAFFESMVSNEEDPGFVAKAILLAKAKKKAAEEDANSSKVVAKRSQGLAKRSQGRKKGKQNSNASEEQGSSTTESTTGREKRMWKTTTNQMENRRSGRQKNSIVDYSPGGRRQHQKVCRNVGHEHFGRIIRMFHQLRY